VAYGLSGHADRKSAQRARMRGHPATIRGMTMLPFRVTCRRALAAFALAAGCVGAQTPATDAERAAVGLPRLPDLPGSSALPESPRDTRLPGPDPRQCGTSKWSALCPMGRWTQFATIDVHLKAPGFAGEYTVEQPLNGEIHATYREQGGQQRRGGEIVLIGAEGYAYRSREAFANPDAIIDYMMSSPIMVTKLAVVLLDLGVLGAPAEVTRPQSITAANATQFIRTEAPRMAALYGPPWTMTGTVRPAGNEQIAFSMRLRYRPVDTKGKASSAKTDTIELNGTISFAAKRPTMPDTFDLVGWKLMKGDEKLAAVSTLSEARELLPPN
jgi:hypothetical protein